MDDTVENDIRKSIEENIIPYAESHGGKIVFRRFENGIVYISLEGTCDGCSAADVTVRFGVERMLRRKFEFINKVIVL